MARAAKKTAKKKTAAKKRASRKTRGSKVPVKTVSAEPAKAEQTVAPLHDIEKLFSDFLQRRWPHPFQWEWPEWADASRLLPQGGPSIDIVDRPKEVVVRAQAPGVEKEDLDVSIVDRTLTIKGSSRKEEKEEGEDYFRQEIRTGAFTRSVTLPSDVNVSRAKATFKDGVVELHLPKVRASKRHSIEVQ